MNLTHEQREAARAAVQEIAKANGGTITPAQVVEHAKDEDSPLHSYFEWDDEKASENYRKMQARALIRSVRVSISYETKKVNTVAFVRDPSKESSEAGYVSVSRIKSDEEQARDVMIAEFKRAGAALKRARGLAAYFDMEDRVSRFLSDLDVMRDSIAESRVQQ